MISHDSIRQAIIGRFAGGQPPATKELSPGARRIVELYAKALMQPDRPQSPAVKAILKRIKAIR